MIANCHLVGLDYYKASLPEYLEAIEAHNARHPTKDGKAPRGEPVIPSDGLRAFMRAHAHEGAM